MVDYAGAPVASGSGGGAGGTQTSTMETPLAGPVEIFVDTR